MKRFIPYGHYKLLSLGGARVTFCHQNALPICICQWPDRFENRVYSLIFGGKLFRKSNQEFLVIYSRFLSNTDPLNF